MSTQMVGVWWDLRRLVLLLRGLGETGETGGVGEWLCVCGERREEG